MPGYDTSSSVGSSLVPAVASIKKKLTHWSLSELSLAKRRVLVANQLLLALAWYVSTLLKEIYFSVQGIRQEFPLMVHKILEHMVRFPTVTLPLNEEGLGISNLERQLLVKLRGLIRGGSTLGRFS